MQIDRKIWNDFRNEMSYDLSHIYNQHAQLLFICGKKFSNDDDTIKDSIQHLFFDLIRKKPQLGETDNKESLNDALLAFADLANSEYRITTNKIYMDKEIKKLSKK